MKMEKERTEFQNERQRMMLETPVPSLVFKMALPTIVSMLVMSVYNMADTYFVSYLGTAATGAVGINLSLMSFIQMAAPPLRWARTASLRACWAKSGLQMRKASSPWPFLLLSPSAL